MSLYLFIIGGLAIASIFHINSVQDDQWYLISVAVLLAGGLYSSTFGIAINEFRQHFGLILRAITIGVFLKAFIIGSAMSLVLRDPFGFILGVIVAQIDPLATARLMRGNRMTKKARAILGAWASFDDPMTVIMSLYAPVAVALITGAAWRPVSGSMQDVGLTGYLLETGVNLLFAGGIFVLWKLMKRHSRASNYVVVVLIALGIYGLLIGALSIAVYYFWMLGIAVVGLFLRPPIEKAIDFSLHWALSMAAVLLGILMINGINVWGGVALGFAAYSAQIIVGLLMTKRLRLKDRLHISFAQQNGITAMILALLFETYYPGTVAIVAPGIITVNVLHVVANLLLDAHLEKDYSKLTLGYQLQRLKAHISRV
jgi:NhaP-type Na+/H+ or K+/H+ antiporter